MLKEVYFALLIFCVWVSCTYAGLFHHGYGYGKQDWPINMGLHGSTLHNFYPGDWGNFQNAGNMGTYQYFQYDPMWNAYPQGGHNWGQVLGGSNWNNPGINLNMQNWNGVNNMNGWNSGMWNGDLGFNNNWNNVGWNNPGFNSNWNSIGWGNPGWNNNWNTLGWNNNWNNFGWNNNINGAWNVPTPL